MSKSSGDLVVQEAARTIPVYKKVDVAVAGGGPAGFAAAVSAARNGAKVLLIERSTYLGGMGTQGFIAEFHSSQNLSGIFKEVLLRLSELGAAQREIVPGSFAYPFNPEVLKFVLTDFVEEAGANLLLSTAAVDVVQEEGRVRGVIIENKSGRQAVLADVVIDASGDADLAARAGAPEQEHAVPQPMVMMFRIGGIDYDRVQEYAMNHPEEFRHGTWWSGGPIDGEKEIHLSGWRSLLKEAQASGALPKGITNSISLFGVTSSLRATSMGYIYGIKSLKRDPFNADDLSQAEIEGRKSVRLFCDFLKTVPGFEKTFLVDIADSIGIRDSRRIGGDYTVTREDIFERRIFDDEVVLHPHRGANISGWVMHPSDGSEGSEAYEASLKIPQQLFIIGIPYRCLLPKGIEQLLVAGKTISMTYEAHTRCRQMPTCMALGQAAGAAAAMASRQKILARQVDVKALRDLLKKQGANIDDRQAIFEATRHSDGVPAT